MNGDRKIRLYSGLFSLLLIPVIQIKTTTPWDPFVDPTITDVYWTTKKETTGGVVTLKPENGTTPVPTRKSNTKSRTTVVFSTSTMSPNDSSADLTRLLLKQSAVVISWGSLVLAISTISASVLLNLFVWLIFYSSYLKPVTRFRQVRDKIIFAEALLVRRVVQDELIGQLSVKADFDMRRAMDKDSSTVLYSIRNVPGPQMFAKYRAD